MRDNSVNSPIVSKKRKTIKDNRLLENIVIYRTELLERLSYIKKDFPSVWSEESKSQVWRPSWFGSLSHSLLGDLVTGESAGAAFVHSVTEAIEESVGIRLATASQDAVLSSIGILSLSVGRERTFFDGRANCEWRLRQSKNNSDSSGWKYESLLKESPLPLQNSLPSLTVVYDAVRLSSQLVIP